MKNLFLLLCIILISLNSSSLAQTSFPDTSWTAQTSGVTENLHVIAFTDTLNGWIAGSKSILHTTNGGQQWKITDSLTSENQNIKDLLILSDHNQWMIIEKDSMNSLGETIITISSILNKNDSGTQWTTKFETDEYRLQKIYFIDSLTGIAIGSKGCIFKTENSGEEWLLSDTFNVLLKGLFFINEGTGWIVGDDSTVLKTTDTAKTWVIKNGLPEYSSLNCVYFIDEMNGWTGGSIGRLFSTKDGGETWKLHQFDYYDYFYSLYFKNDSIGWACSASGRLHYALDGDTTWLLDSLGINNLYDIFFIDDNKGWIVGQNGLILHTKNGGGEVNIKEPKPVNNNMTAKIYPNPFYDQLMCSIKTDIPRQILIQLFDIQGRKLSSVNNLVIKETHSINLHNLFGKYFNKSNGIYLIRISDGYTSLDFKIIRSNP